MLNTYVDRGIIKWSAFDALTGYHSMLEEMKYRLEKKERPLLSDDALEELNRTLQEAIENKLEVEVRYFHDGYTRFTFGRVKKIDYALKQIILSTLERFQAEDIVEIHII